MDTTLALTQKPVLAAQIATPEQEPPSDKKVPVVKGLDASATLPAEKPFVAQVVTARLSGTAFPDNPAEIAPEERTLRPYDTPMLPSDKEPEEEIAAEETSASDPDNALKTDASGDTSKAARDDQTPDTAQGQLEADRTTETGEQPGRMADSSA